MTGVLTSETALSQLEQMLASGKLPGDARKRGMNLLERLKSPVRVVILGLPGSGKSQLLNMLTGQTIIPDGVNLPTLQVEWAEVPQTVLMFEDGTTEIRDGLDFESISSSEPIFVKVGTPLPILKKISLLEVVADESTEVQKAAIDWAVKRADIALWCSQDFTPIEAELWARVPDGVKDHSFFVLTKADLPSAMGDLSQRLPTLQKMVEDEFYSLFPVATLQAIAALDATGQRNDAAFKSSGGKALFIAILKQVESGRQADLDSALLFLSRYGSKALPETKPEQENSPADNSVSGKNGPTNAAPVPGKPAVPNVDSNIHAPTGGVGIAAGGNPRPQNQLCSKALGYLQDEAAKLSFSITENSSNISSDVLDHCVTAANGLCDMFLNENEIDEELHDLQEDVMETAEVLLLMQLEEGDGPAADAVTLLLQLRKGLEAKMAA